MFQIANMQPISWLVSHDYANRVQPVDLIGQHASSTVPYRLGERSFFLFVFRRFLYETTNCTEHPSRGGGGSCGPNLLGTKYLNSCRAHTLVDTGSAANKPKQSSAKELRPNESCGPWNQREEEKAAHGKNVTQLGGHAKGLIGNGTCFFPCSELALEAIFLHQRHAAVFLRWKVKKLFRDRIFVNLDKRIFLIDELMQ